MARASRRRRYSPRFLPVVGRILLALLVISWLPVLLLRFIEPPFSSFMLTQTPGDRYLFEWSDWHLLGDQAALAVIAAEDQNFAHHPGFDLNAIEAAVAGRLQGERLRGASTISQQVAKNLFLWSGRSLFRKGLEAWFTLLIEVTWPKRRILEIYLNIAEFGPNIYGITAASRVYFGKPPSRLTAEEAALLAAVLPNPKQMHVGRPSAYVRGRQAWIQQQMVRIRAGNLLDQRR